MLVCPPWLFSWFLLRQADASPRFLQGAEAARMQTLMLIIPGIGIFLILLSLCLLRKQCRMTASPSPDHPSAITAPIAAGSSFLSEIGHEFRTPMNGIMGTTDLMLRDPSLPAKTREDLEVIHSSGKQLMEVINHFLHFAKSGATTSTPPSVPHPFASARAATTEATPTPFPLSARILVADDNRVNQRVLKNQLEHLGMKVTLCSDGSEALHLARKGAHEVILMDCQMPIMDGFEATRRIREWEKENAMKRVPIIAVTAHVVAGNAELCLEAGMDGYLPKPVEVDLLRKELLRWLPLDAGEPQKAGHPRPQTDTSSPPPVVDECQLKACLTGDPELDRDLVRMAADQMSEVLERLEKALQEDASTDWQQAAHLGRGSGATMGFLQMSTLFHQAEFEATQTAARRQVLAELQAAIMQLDARLQELGYPATVTT